ncbi:unnamed protein product [Colias eurytheme]|nr:unnamed protein product [Colias eurytheme]
MNNHPDPPDPPDPPYSPTVVEVNRIPQKRHLASEDASIIAKSKKTSIDNNPNAASVQTLYTHPSLNEKERRYSELDNGPFIVHISKIETEPSAGTILRPIKVGQLLVNNGIKNIISDGIKRIGRNRISIEFSNAIDANQFCINPILEQNSLVCTIPTYNFSRMGIVKKVPTDFSMQEFVDAVELPRGYGIILKARRLNRKIRTDDSTEYTPTTTVVITIQGQRLPERIFLYKNSLPVEIYRLPSIQCLKCCRFGHVQTQCRSNPRCYRCTKDHNGESCNVSECSASCISCSGSHFATDSNCPEHTRQRSIKYVMSEENISYQEASLRFPASRKSFAEVTRQVPSSPHTSLPNPIPSTSTSTSYKKTVFRSPRPRAPLGKSYDRAAHQDIIQAPSLDSQNGCALSGNTPSFRKPCESNVLVSCISFFYDIIKTCNEADLPSDVKEILFKIIDTIKSNNGSEDHYTMELADGYAGAALLVNRSIPFSLLPIPNHSPSINAVAAKVFNFTIVSIYISDPNSSLIPDIYYILSSLPSPIFVLGDFNAHHVSWGSHKTDTFSLSLLDLFDDLNLCTLNSGSPTHLVLPNQNPNSAVDLSLSSPSLSLLCSWNTLPNTHGSDHFPILISFEHDVPSPPQSPLLKYRTTKANWSDYSHSLEFQLNSLPFPSLYNPLPIYSMFVSCIISSANNHIPIKNPSTYKPSTPWWDSECTAIIRERSEAEKMYIEQMSMQNFLNFKQISAKAKKLLVSKKRSGWLKFCESLSPKTPPSLVWKQIKRFRSSRSQNNITSSNCSLWLEDFINKLAPPFVPSLENLPAAPSFLPHTNSLDAPFTMDELSCALEGLNDSSPGIDGIPYSFISQSSPKTKLFFLDLINSLFASGSVPESWKSQIIIPVLKPNKNPSDSNSYRPIALSSCLSKITEILIKNRLEWFVENNNILPPSQFGFRKGYSTLDSIAILTTDIQIAFKKKHFLAGVFLDIESAYDNVMLPVLRQKLLQLSIPEKMVRFICNLFMGRSICVRSDNSLSPPRLVWRGLPQGVYLDSRMTGITHSNYISQKCEKGVNVLRALSGVRWGAHPFSQKLLYNAIVRSHFDYASFLLEPMNKRGIQCWDKIQSKSLRIVLGAMKSTAINALQIECGEPPLSLRRQFLCDRFMNAYHSFQAIVARNWEGWTHIYTDASKISDKENVGIAVWIPKFAIMLCRKCPPITSTFVDSKSCLQCILSNQFRIKTKYPVILQIRKSLWECKLKGIEITLAWIPGHSGIPGNESADWGAKSAMRISSESHDLVYSHDLSLLAKSKLMFAWEKSWASTRFQKGKFYSKIQNDIPVKPCERIVSMKPSIDIDSLRSEHESDEQWEVRRMFMVEHKDNFEEEELVTLAQLFTNIEFLGCRYPQATMKRIAKLAEKVSAKYKESRKNKLKRTFVQASDAAEQKAKRSFK